MADENVRAKFYRSGDRDMIEIRIVGDPNTVIRKVTQADVERFHSQWTSYKAGNPDEPVEGMPLTEVSGISQSMADKLALEGIKTAEQLAALSDAAAVGAIGMGAQTFRRAARDAVDAAAFRAQRETVASVVTRETPIPDAQAPLPTIEVPQAGPLTLPQAPPKRRGRPPKLRLPDMETTTDPETAA